MNHWYRILTATLLLAFSSPNVYAENLRIGARYGGTICHPPAEIEGFRLGSMGGSHTLGLDLSGPQIFWRVRPVIAYDYHWSGRKGEYPVTTQTDITILALQIDTKLGYAKAVFYCGAAYFNEIYHSRIEADLYTDLKADTWGVALGLDFRFKFFDSVDAVVGYRYLGREMQRFVGVSPVGIPYEVTGRRGDSCISAGVSVVVF